MAMEQQNTNLVMFYTHLAPTNVQAVNTAAALMD